MVEFYNNFKKNVKYRNSKYFHLTEIILKYFHTWVNFECMKLNNSNIEN